MSLRCIRQQILIFYCTVGVVVMAGKTRNMVFKFDGANVSTQAFGREFIPLVANVYALVQACSNEEVRIVSIENNCIKFTLADSEASASAPVYDLSGRRTNGILGRGIYIQNNRKFFVK